MSQPSKAACAPPPPMLSKPRNQTKRLSPAALFGVKTNDVIRRTKLENVESIRSDLQARLRLARKQNQSPNNNQNDNSDNSFVKQWIFVDKNLHGRIQSGPSCGLVALQIAVEYLFSTSLQQQQQHDDEAAGEKDDDGTTTNSNFCELDCGEILKRAQQLQFTNLGEMFSSYDLASLCNDLFGSASEKRAATVNARVVDLANEFDSDAKRLQFVLQTCHNPSQLLLIPYDADKDNTPCEKNGARAHWAIVKGMLLPNVTTSTSTTDNDSEAVDIVSAERTTELIDDKLLSSLQINASHAQLICTHSKSKRLSVWHALTLLASSAQLHRPDTTRAATGQFKMPEQLDECLASKAVLITKQTPSSS